jgi:PKD repeat protein
LIRRQLIGVLTVAALCGLAPPADAVLVHAANGQAYGIAFRPGVNASSLPGLRVRRAQALTLAAGSVSYHGGPVLHSTAPYLIFWAGNSTIPTPSESVLEQYLTDAAADSGKATDVYGVVRQYTDSTGFADYKQTFSGGQVLVDNTTFPTNCVSTTTHCVTDADIQSELTSLIAGHALGRGTGSNAPVYIVVTPADTDVCMTSPADCATSTFCAYHSALTDAGQSVVYASLPLAALAGGAKGCQGDGNPDLQEPNHDQADVLADNMSHELNESITDPLPNNPAWFSDSSGNEIADNCQAAGPNDPLNGTSPNAYLPTLGGVEASGTLYDQLLNGHQYYTQTEWSNGDGGCRTQPSADALAPAFTYSPTPVRAGTAVSFHPSSTTSPGDGITSTTWDFGDGSDRRFTAAGIPASASRTYSTPGVYNVTLTLVDSVGNVATVAHTVTVSGPPHSTFSASTLSGTAPLSVTFDASGSSDPTPGASITSFSWSFGDGATAALGAKSPRTSHLFGHVGRFTVALATKDSLGLMSFVAQIVTALPGAEFTVAHPGSGQPVSFTGSPTDPGGSVTAITWSFGDGGRGSGTRPSHTYVHPGAYTVTMTVRDRSGLSGSVSHRVRVRTGDKIVKASAHGTTLSITLNGPGRLSVSGRSFAVTHARTIDIKLKLSAAQERELARTHKLTLSVPVTFVPAAGDTQHRTIHTTVRS